MKNFYDYLESVENQKKTYQEGVVSGLVNKGFLKLADYVIKSENDAKEDLKKVGVYTNYINIRNDEMKFIQFANEVNYSKKFKTEDSIKEELIKRFPYLKDHSFKQILLMLNPENIELLKKSLRKDQQAKTVFSLMDKTSTNLMNLLTLANQDSFTIPQDKIIDFFNQFGKIIKNTKLIEDANGRISKDILENIQKQINSNLPIIQNYLKRYVIQNVPETGSSEEFSGMREKLLDKLEKYNKPIDLAFQGVDKDKRIGVSFD